MASTGTGDPQLGTLRSSIPLPQTRPIDTAESVAAARLAGDEASGGCGAARALPDHNGGAGDTVESAGLLSESLEPTEGKGENNSGQEPAVTGLDQADYDRINNMVRPREQLSDDDSSSDSGSEESSKPSDDSQVVASLINRCVENALSLGSSLEPREQSSKAALLVATQVMEKSFEEPPNPPLSPGSKALPSQDEGAQRADALMLESYGDGEAVREASAFALGTLPLQAAGVILVTHHQQHGACLALLRNCCSNSRRGTWESAWGSIEEGSNELTTAIKELVEESGCSVLCPPRIARQAHDRGLSIVVPLSAEGEGENLRITKSGFLLGLRVDNLPLSGYSSNLEALRSLRLQEQLRRGLRCCLETDGVTLVKLSTLVEAQQRTQPGSRLTVVDVKGEAIDLLLQKKLLYAPSMHGVHQNGLSLALALAQENPLGHKPLHAVSISTICQGTPLQGVKTLLLRRLHRVTRTSQGVTLRASAALSSASPGEADTLMLQHYGEQAAVVESSSDQARSHRQDS